MHLSLASPRGGTPRLMWGNTGTMYVWMYVCMYVCELYLRQGGPISYGAVILRGPVYT